MRPRLLRSADLGVLVIGLAIVPLLWMGGPYLGIDRFRLPKELGAILIAGIAAGAGLALRSRWRMDAVTVLLALFFVWSFVSLIATATVISAGWRQLGITWAGLLVYATASRYARSQHAVRALLVGVVLGATAVAAMTLLEYTGAISGWSLLRRGPSGVFGNRNHAAHFLTIAMPASFALALGAGASRQVSLLRLAQGAALLSAAAIIVTRSRAAWLAAGVTIAVALVLASRTPLKRAAGHWLAFIAAGIVAGVLLPTPLAWRSSSPMLETASSIADYRTGSGRGRILQYRTTLRMVAARPLLGMGPGNWSVEYPAYATAGDPSLLDGIMPVDRLPLSDWLGTMAEAGAPALAILLLVGAVLAARAARALRSARTQVDRGYGAALVMLLVSVAILGSFDAVLQSAAPLIIAAALGAALSGRELSHRYVVTTRNARVLLGGLLLGLSAFFAYLSVRHVRAVRAYGDRPTEAALRTAIAIDPTDYVALLRLAFVYVTEGRCDVARPYLARAATLQPRARIVLTLGESCVPVEPNAP